MARARSPGQVQAALQTHQGIQQGNGPIVRGQRPGKTVLPRECIGLADVCGREIPCHFRGCLRRGQPLQDSDGPVVQGNGRVDV